MGNDLYSASNSSLMAIYFAIFDRHLNYTSFLWVQNLNSKVQINTIQSITKRNKNNQPGNSHFSLRFLKNNILRFKGCVCYIFASLLLSLEKNFFETRKNVFYFTPKALFILKKIKVHSFRYLNSMTSFYA